LVVGDDPDRRLQLREALERAGPFEIAGVAADGRQAAALAAVAQPDLVVLDRGAPGQDGLSDLADVREVSPTAAMIVMIVGPASVDGAGRPAGVAGSSEDGTQAGWDELAAHIRRLSSDAVPAGDPTALAAHWHLPADLRSGGLARRQLRTLLHGWGLAMTLDAAQLLTSELINNAVVHAGSDVLLTVSHHARLLRIEVTDAGAGALHRLVAGPEDTRGRGMLLVEEMSDGWGAAVNGSAKTLWFELITDVPLASATDLAGRAAAG
jgi:CheY-like chemotaxis protein/anti-sigma regulatory factor (Ser/Thr protein kinase)